jgi:hypothetical protein
LFDEHAAAAPLAATAMLAINIVGFMVGSPFASVAHDG